jgi:hypothetical protein
MEKAALIEALRQKYQELEEGKIHWLQMAPLIEEAKLKHMNVRSIIPRCRVWEIFNGYTFLKAQRPEFLKNPNLTVGAEAISFLMPIYKKMSEEEQKNDFPTLVRDVLSGKTRINTLRVMSRSMRVVQGKDLPTTLNNAPARSERDVSAHKIKAVENAIDVLDFLLDVALHGMSHGELRKHVEIKAHNLSIRLSCVASEDFLRSWKQKEEVRI